MENCPYCNEFMELAADTQECTHISIDPRGEYCCLNCNAHFDLDLQEVPIDSGIGKNPSQPTNPTDTPAQNPSQDSTQESNKDDSSNTDSSKGDSSTESKGDSKEDSKENPNQPQTPQPPQSLTLSNQNQIATAKQIYISLQSYNTYTKIHTDITPVIKSLQDYLAQKHTISA